VLRRAMRVIKNLLLEGTMNPFKHIWFTATTWNRVLTHVLLRPFAAAAKEGALPLEEVGKALEEAPRVTASAAPLDAAMAGVPSERLPSLCATSPRRNSTRPRCSRRP
jgi:hypothetical protein